LADVYARAQRHFGKEVFFAHAVDGFASAVLDEAVLSGSSPEEQVVKACAAIDAVERHLSLSVRPSTSVQTSDPSYYRFTQWLFLEILERGFAVLSKREEWSCARCKRAFRSRGLRSCPTCHESLRAREVVSWRLDLESFGERLFADVEKASWPPQARKQQKAIIGRRRGSEVAFAFSRPFETDFEHVAVFTTHVEAIFGVTFLLVSPGHPVLSLVTDPTYEDEIERYLERLETGAEPRISAVRTGGFALNPANLERIPVLVSPLADDPFHDGVMPGIPAHDVEHFELARRARLKVREVIHSHEASFDHNGRLREPYVGEGILTNSAAFNGLPSRVARDRIVQFLARRGICQRVTRNTLRSLPLSVESSWGPPVPVLHCPGCGPVAVALADLPVHPPRSSSRLPGAAAGADPVRTCADEPCPRCGESAVRDARRIHPWLGTAWSFLRLPLPELGEGFPGLRRDFDQPSTVCGSGIDPHWEPAASTTVVRPGRPPAEAPAGAGAPADDASVQFLAPEIEDDAFGEAPDRTPAGADVGGHPDAGAESASGVEAVDPPASAPLVSGNLEAAAAESARTDPGGAQATLEPQGPPAPRAQAEEAEGGSDLSAASDAAQDSSEAPEVEEEDDDEAVEPRPETMRPRVELRPFSATQLGRLLPVDAVFVPLSMKLKEVIGVRCLMKFLYDSRHVQSFEPFRRFFYVGEMEYSEQGGAVPAGSTPAPRSAVVEPHWPQIIDRFGSDSLRIVLLSHSSPCRRLVFGPDDLHHARRLLTRIWNQVLLRIEHGKFVSRRVLVEKHQLIFDVTQRLQRFKFHTAVSAIAKFVNFISSPETTVEEMDRHAIETFLIVLSPFAPFMAQELWERSGKEGDVSSAPWPSFSDELVNPPEREFAILVNGRLRDRMTQPADLEPEKLESRALQRDRIRELVGQGTVRRVVVVPRRLVNVVLDGAERTETAVGVKDAT
jgi:leucyl-tRNA synthetase